MSNVQVLSAAVPAREVASPDERLERVEPAALDHLVWHRCLKAVAEHADPAQAWIAVASILKEECPADLIGLVNRAGLFAVNFPFEGLADREKVLNASVNERLIAAGRAACSGNNPVFIGDCQPAGTILAIRIGEHTDADQAVVAWFSGNPVLTNRTLTIYQYAAASLASAARCVELTTTRQRLEHTAAVVDLVDQLTGCPSLDSACRKLAEDLRQYARCDRVYVSVRTKGTENFAVKAVAGCNRAEFDTELRELVEAVCEEAALRGTQGVWPPQNQDRVGLCVHRRFVNMTRAKEIVSVPLEDSRGFSRGVCLLVFDTQVSLAETRLFLRVAAPVVGSALAVLQRAERGRLARRLASLSSKAWWKKRRFAAAIALACIGAMLLPVPHVVKCDCELQPVERRFVAAPFNGKLENAFVEPGDVVAKDDLLVQLDGRELRLEQAGLDADRERLQKKRDGALIERDFGTASVLKYEIDRIDAKLELLHSRFRELELRSPIAGLIVTGDLQRAQGMPVTRGQSLLEIAPLDQMLVEVAIPEADIRHTSAGMPVTVLFESDAGSVWTGTLARIHPRAENRDQSHVFIGEFALTNNHDVLRPGMHGQARLDAGQCSLGWRLFHRFWEHLRLMVGW